MVSDTRKRRRSRDRSPRARSRSRSKERSQRLSRRKDKSFRKRRRSSASSSSSSSDHGRNKSRERSRRSRSKDRNKKSKRSRSRSPDRRKRASNKDDSKSSKTSRDKKRDDSESASKKTKNDEKKDESKKEATGKDYEQNQLEEEMRKRKERIENWRKQRKAETLEKEAESDPNRKGWTLEDDEEDDAEDVNSENGDTGNENSTVTQDEDVDPLDAFMVQVDRQVSKQKQDGDKRKGITKSEKGKATVITTVVKKKIVAEADKQKSVSKGELMVNDEDAMEYSSEGEEEEDVLADPNNIGYKTKPKKELAAVDHSKVYYQPFRKSFYVEVPELAKLTPEEVEVMLQDLENIKVKGKNTPKPIKTWAQAGLSLKIMEVLKKCNYEKPTPIQAQAMPCVMSGRDMIGIAKTGSGKTLAFVIPMLRHVLDQPSLDRDDGPIAIIMTPTRELALQIHREAKKFCKPLSLRVTCVYGGTGISEQIAELKRGAEIIVCTPGRMIDMLTANNGRVTNCRRCTYIVLDEADRMFDMGFEPQ
ncbi:probable ATP-dependent RNA helicase DDX46, partial [Paramuricea clavata]